MKDPVLIYRDNMLYLEFPGWTRKQMDASRENLICWRLLKGSESTLVAEPLLLALWEAKETYKKLKVQNLDEVRQMVDLSVQSVPGGPELAGLKDFQVEPAKKLWGRERAILTAAPGLGKTVMALKALSEKYADVVVIVVPLTSFDGWREEILKWYQPDSPYTLHLWRKWQEVRPLHEDSLDTDVVLTTPNVILGIGKLQSAYGQGLASVFYDARDKDSFLILDESFLYQNKKAIRSDAMEELACNFKTIWQLTGMPVSNANDDLFFQLKLLYPASFRSYWKFARRYCLLETNFWGTKVVGNLPDSEERLKKDLQDIVITCDYPANIPDWIPMEIDCPMTERQEEIYLKAKEELFVDAKTLGSAKPLGIKRVVALTTRLMQIASNPLILGGVNDSGKWGKLLDMLQGEMLPALVWVKYVVTATEIERAIQQKYPHYRISSITGATKAADRYSRVVAFQNQQLDVLIINDGVGKYSLTLTAAKAAFYLERDYNAEAYYQSLYRARRVTSQHPVRIVLLKSILRSGKPTVDQLVHDSLSDRSENALKLTIGQLVGRC